MKSTGWVLLAVLFLAVGGSLFGNDGPVVTQVITVRQGAAALFSVATGDVTDYAFVILQAPANGILIGVPPHLVYIPRDGFWGNDWMSFAATSPAGVLQIGTVKILVLGTEEGMAMPALLSEGELVFSGPTFAVDSYRLVFTLQQRFRYFEQSLRATWTDVGFTSFVGATRIELEGSAPSPWRLPIVSTLAFDPTLPGLSSWTVEARTDLVGATWIYTFFFSGTDPEASSYTTFQVQGTVSPFTFDALTRFESLTPTFGSTRLIVKGPWICVGCPTNWELEFLQTKAGFGHLSLLVKDIEIPCSVCAGLRILLDTKVTFTTVDKTVEPALRIASVVTACVKPLVALPTGTSWFGLEGIEVYGFEIRCDLAGYSLRLATSFNEARDSAVTGDLRFFELWQLEGPVVPCCGNPGRFQLTAYFVRGSGNLFGFGMGNVVIYFPLSREVLVNLGLKVGMVDPLDPTKTWILTTGWRGIW